MDSVRQFVVVGGSGFVGGHLREYLATRFPGAEVHVLDIRITEPSQLLHHVDIRKPIRIDAKFGPETVLFNLAAIHKTPGHPDYDYFETNIRGAENVCAWAAEQGIRTIVFTSSIAPYGPSEEPRTEENLPTPNIPYGISKLVAEKIHLAWLAADPERRLSVGRPGVIFGKGEGGNFTRLYKALNKGMFAYAGRRDTRKAAIYVKDLCRTLVDMGEDRSRTFKLYNCCLPEAPTIKEIVHTVSRVTGTRAWVPMIPAQLLRAGASMLGFLGAMGLGFHPDRVRKLMLSTNVSGASLQKDFPLQFTLESALRDWWEDCGKVGLF